MALKMIRFVAAVLALLAFSALSKYASIKTGGFIALWSLGFSSPGNLQILIDLMIACGFATAWMLRDGKEQKISVWPFILITLPLGSFGPLIYLVFREWRLMRRPGEEGEPIS